MLNRPPSSKVATAAILDQVAREIWGEDKTEQNHSRSGGGDWGWLGSLTCAQRSTNGISFRAEKVKGNGRHVHAG